MNMKLTGQGTGSRRHSEVTRLRQFNVLSSDTEFEVVRCVGKTVVDRHL